jgi:hypothetical protein
MGVVPRGLWFVFGFVLAAGVGCADPKVSLREGPRTYAATDYPQVLDRWTRERRLITVAALDDLLTVTATYESWDFRWAYVARYAQDYRLTASEQRSLFDKMLGEARDSHLFYVALYGPNYRYADLTRPSPLWIVRLIDDHGNETAPLAIEQVAKPGPMERRYFPFTSVWRRVFRIRFPKRASDGAETISPQSAFVGLRFAGAEGNQELTWELARSGDGIDGSKRPGNKLGMAR